MNLAIQEKDGVKFVVLPNELLEQMNLDDDKQISVLVQDNCLAITKPERKVRRERKSIEQRYEEFYGMSFEEAIEKYPYDVPLVDWGPPVGSEEW